MTFVFVSNTLDSCAIILSNRRLDEKSEMLVDDATEVEEEHQKSSFRRKVAALRCTSNAFLSRPITNGEEFEVVNSMP